MLQIQLMTYSLTSNSPAYYRKSYSQDKVSISFLKMIYRRPLEGILSPDRRCLRATGIRRFPIGRLKRLTVVVTPRPEFIRIIR